MIRRVFPFLLLGLCPLSSETWAQPDAPEATALPEALAAFEQGDLTRVIEILEPQRGQLEDRGLAVLAVAYLETGRVQDAIGILEPLVGRADADPAVLFHAGRAALLVNQPARAEEYLRRSLERSPGSPAARELGLLLGRKGELAEAYSLLRPWVSQDPEDTEALEAAAFCAVSLERVPEAEELLARLPQDSPRVRLLRGKVQMLRAEPFAALEILQPLVGQADAALDLDVRRTMAEAFVMVGQAEEAVNLLVGKVGGQPRVALELSHAQYQSGDLEGAVTTLEPFARRLLEMSEQMPSPPEPALSSAIALDYGRLLVGSGRHAEAVPYLELTTRLQPENKQGWQYLGQALAAAGRSDEARAALERFREISSSEVPASLKETELQLDVDDPTGRELREAVRLIGQDKPDEALVVVRREIMLAPQDPRPRLIEAQALLKLDRAEEALGATGAALEIAPDYPDAYYFRGVVGMAMGQLPQAEADFRTALELAPEHTAAMSDLAVLLIETGASAEARSLLERVLEIRPDDRVAAENLQRLDGAPPD